MRYIARFSKAFLIKVEKIVDHAKCLLGCALGGLEKLVDNFANCFLVSELGADLPV